MQASGADSRTALQTKPRLCDPHRRHGLNCHTMAREMLGLRDERDLAPDVPGHDRAVRGGHFGQREGLVHEYL